MNSGKKPYRNLAKLHTSITKKAEQRIQRFISKCLCRILSIFWPNEIYNVNLWEKTNQTTQRFKSKEKMGVDGTYTEEGFHYCHAKSPEV